MRRTAVNEFMCWQHAKINTSNKQPPEQIQKPLSWLSRVLWSLVLFPKAQALQTIDFSLLNFWKSPFPARDTVNLTKLVKILWQLPTLTKCSMPSRGASVLDACSIARTLHSDGSRFLNFCKTPLQAWEMSVWTKTSNFHQNWRNSTDGCPLWTAIARPAEVQLTWVLFLWLANAQLMIWGFWIFAKLHSRPEICSFENGLTKSVTFASIFVFFDGYPL